MFIARSLTFEFFSSLILSPPYFWGNRNLKEGCNSVPFGPKATGNHRIGANWVKRHLVNLKFAKKVLSGPPYCTGRAHRSYQFILIVLDLLGAAEAPPAGLSSTLGPFEWSSAWTSFLFFLINPALLKKSTKHYIFKQINKPRKPLVVNFFETFWKYKSSSPLIKII